MKRGETLGIIGPTGAGKTTVVNLLIRFFFPDSGRILIDGTDIREMGEHELRARFGAALQKDFLFQDTMEGNIRLGRQLEDSEIHEALRVAQAEDFAMEKGMGELLNIRGANLSGGQKQRIMLARALAGRPEILILDDSSSALDYATDARFRAALAGRDGQCTVIMIAQRISSIMHAEQILCWMRGRKRGWEPMNSSSVPVCFIRKCMRYRWGRGLMRRILSYIKPVWPGILLAVILSLGGNVACPAGPRYSGMAIDCVSAGAGHVDIPGRWGTRG